MVGAGPNGPVRSTARLPCFTHRQPHFFSGWVPQLPEPPWRKSSPHFFATFLGMPVCRAGITAELDAELYGEDARRRRRLIEASKSHLFDLKLHHQPLQSRQLREGVPAQSSKAVGLSKIGAARVVGERGSFRGVPSLEAGGLPQGATSLACAPRVLQAADSPHRALSGRQATSQGDRANFAALVVVGFNLEEQGFKLRRSAIYEP
jgi:hypothetical protein